MMITVKRPRATDEPFATDIFPEKRKNYILFEMHFYYYCLCTTPFEVPRIVSRTIARKYSVGGFKFVQGGLTF